MTLQFYVSPCSSYSLSNHHLLNLGISPFNLRIIALQVWWLLFKRKDRKMVIIVKKREAWLVNTKIEKSIISNFVKVWNPSLNKMLYCIQNQSRSKCAKKTMSVCCIATGFILLSFLAHLPVIYVFCKILWTIVKEQHKKLSVKL